MKVLLEHGASIDKANDGTTPLLLQQQKDI
jgi:hypothetical protein